jgi:cyclopropane fatty-acyl-phospholipid synthase-like methyltransferase
MFEHMKNYGKLLEKISGWLQPQGKLFVHIFTHKWKPYHFEKGISSFKSSADPNPWIRQFLAPLKKLTFDKECIF